MSMNESYNDAIIISFSFIFIQPLNFMITKTFEIFVEKNFNLKMILLDEVDE